MTACGVCSAPTDGFACKPCIGRLERQVADLSWLLDELTVTETRQGRTYRASGPAERDAEAAVDPEGHVRADLRSRDGRIALRATALPFDEAASVLRDEAWSTIGAWIKHLAESRGVDTPLNATALVWLAGHAESIRWDEAAAEMVDEISDVHRRLTRAIDSSPSRTFWGRCDAETMEPVEADGVVTVQTGECGRDLYAKEHAATIVCDGWRGDGHGCGATRATEDVRSRIRELTEGAMVTISEVLYAEEHLFPERGAQMPPRRIVEGWTKGDKPRLKPSGKNRAGELLFSGRELLRLIDAYRPQKPRRSSSAA